MSGKSEGHQGSQCLEERKEEGTYETRAYGRDPAGHCMDFGVHPE